MSCNNSKSKKNEPASSVEASTSKPLQIDEFETFVDRPKMMMGPLTFQHFNELWSIAERHIHIDTEALENSPAVKNANNKLGNKEQKSAQYGRTTPPALQKIAEITNLTSDQIFLDIGHGIGNAPLQMAYTIGCKARGIELVESRHHIAVNCFKYNLERQLMIIQERDDMVHQVGEVELRVGTLSDKQHFDFLTSVDVTLYNNAHGVFGHKTQKNTSDLTRPTLDAYVAKIFVSMKSGSKMVTLDPLLCLGRTLSEENAMRTQRGLEESLDASFFECTEHWLDGGSFTWSLPDSRVKVYVYTRVFQSSDRALFLCSNPKCDAAKSCMPTAVLQADDGVLLNKDCIYCCTQQKGHVRSTRNKTSNIRPVVARNRGARNSTKLSGKRKQRN